MWIGIDPGKKGAIAVITQSSSKSRGQGSTVIETMPLSETEDDVAEFLDHHASICDFAFLEIAQTRPGQAAGSVLKFGTSYGFCRGILAATKCPRDFVTPVKWQRSLGCLSGGDKKITKAKAQQLFPGYKMTHVISDAILIAEYCRRVRAAEGCVRDLMKPAASVS